MRPFNMEDFKAGKKVVYRDAHHLLILESAMFKITDGICIFVKNAVGFTKHYSDGCINESRNESSLDLMIADENFFAGIKGARNGTAKEFLIAESIEQLKGAGFTDSDIYKLVPTW